MASDINESARKNYKNNHNITPLGDICDIDPKTIENYDILTAGIPCFLAGTKVLTNNGYKNIEDVELTDLLLTHTGSFQRIINLQKKVYNDTLYELDIKYHSEFINCTKEHPFYVREKKIKWNKELKKNEEIFENPEWKEANKLTLNDYFGMIINTNNIIPEFNYDKIINKHKTNKINIKLDKLEYWYLMGYFVGDGWIEENTKADGRLQYTIKFAINNKDETEVVEKLTKVIPIVDKKCDTGKCKKSPYSRQRRYFQNNKIKSIRPLSIKCFCKNG
jgi:hypothetical protein